MALCHPARLESDPAAAAGGGLELKKIPAQQNLLPFHRRHGVFAVNFLA